MRRLFGGKKQPVARPTIAEATDTANKREQLMNTKIKELDKQLADFKNQLKATRPGPAQTRIKQRAMQVLKQKKMLEKQQDQVRGMAWNMEQAKFAQENVTGALYQAEAMKDAAAALKMQMKDVKLNDIEDIVDDMSDLLEDAAEISEILSRSYAVDEDIDEAELDDELAALDEQFAAEEEMDPLPDVTSIQRHTAEAETPAYLLDHDVAEPERPAPLPAGVTRPPAQPARVPAAAQRVDEFGLPVAS